ncbi:uncharacterized protein LOC123690181 [Pieris rapae]|uniref:uncharacterized protein LOC123690181 n=1 Tax=Pieris rapae TaxID=64459 RepID=UPI001E27DCAE|nr:uncharacterized protein LOC123690181 [Pieris rapae]
MTRLYLMEHIMYLGELEANYWEIDHLYGMLHEIERKYKIKDGESRVKDYVEVTKAGDQTGIFVDEAPSSGLNIARPQKRIMNDLSWGTKLKLLKDYRERRVGVYYLREGVTEAEDSMKLKLFRLMYETVRDSDLKVRRAELIRRHYTNSTSFDMGFIIGDITDKFNIISDIALTMKRLYKEWKPMEHISAYEQIANKAIEITNLIDMVRLIERKNTKIARI